MDTPSEKLLVELVRANVNFIVVGGIAVALNGFLRTTEDVDILVESRRFPFGHFHRDARRVVP
jgi:hypothetical protein